MKRALKITGIVLASLVVAAFCVRWYADSRYFDAYDPNVPLNIRVLETETVTSETPPGVYQRIKFTFDSTPGEAIPTLMTLPVEVEGRLPVVVFLHGIGQEKEFLNRITVPFNQTGFAMVCFDQLMQGERRIPRERGWLAQALAFRRRPAKTVNETRRLVDYLVTHPQIDPERIYLVGASYGAITGSTVLAFDKRIRAGILVYGAGDIPGMLEAPAIAEELGRWLPFAQLLAKFFLNPADPLHYVDRISPTPVYFQNGWRDILIAVPAAKALQEKAREPKKIQWYDSDHVGLDLPATRQVLVDGLAWLLDLDNPLRPPEQRADHIPDFLGDLS